MNSYLIGDLILHLAKKMKVESEKELNPLNIGIGQLQVLLVFYRNNPEPINQSYIAKTLSIDKANASRAVNKLIDKEYIVIDTNGNIKNELKLTKVGLSIKKDIFLAFRKVYSEMTYGISKEELNTVESVLSKMKSNME